MLAVQNRMNHAGFLFRQGGVPKLFNHFMENLLFDLRYRTNTSSWLEKVEFDECPVNFEHGVRYRACASSVVREALNKVSDLVDMSEASFYDMGCGKGKTLIIADEEYNFCNIIGVDYYQPFINQAKKNLERRNIDRGQLHFMDMTLFKDYRDTSVVFLYNPAGAIVIDKVRKNLEKYSRKAIVIYNKPEHGELFSDWGLVSRKTSHDPDHSTSIFSFGF